MKRYYFGAIGIALLTIMAWGFMEPLSAQGEEKVRFGYFDYQQVFDKNAKGVYTGYSKEYLDEIARYTGWEYEYVPGNLTECFERLRTGEIDLLCAAQYSPERAEKYEYSKYPIGSEFASMYVLPENEDIYYEDFKAFDGLKVGFVKDSYQNQLFDAYSHEHGFSVEKHYYNSYAELKDALHVHEVDAILSGSLDGEIKEKLVAQFAPSPYYFITTKNNKKVLEGINGALDRLRIDNPYFGMQLYKKYYGEAAAKLRLTRREGELIAHSRRLRVVCDYSANPLEYFDEDTGEFKGAYIEIIKLMFGRSRLQCEFIGARSFEESVEKLKNGEADLILSIYANDAMAKEYNLAFTAPYFQEKSVIVGRKGMIFDEAAILTVAVVRGNSDYSHLIAEKYPFWTVKYYDTWEACLDAVQNGETDISLQNTDLLFNLLMKSNYDDIAIITALNTEIPISIGVSKRLPPEIIGIIDKAVLAVNKKEVNDIAIKNTFSKVEKLSSWDFVKQKKLEISAFVALVVMIILLVTHYVRRSREYALARATYTDRLTGLRNFEKFELDAAALIQRGNPVGYAVVYMDIEKFKYINEVFGYNRGNAILIYFAKLFMHQLQAGELFARVSGDRFVALLRYENKEELSGRLSNFYKAAGSLRSTMLDSNTLAIVSGIYCLDSGDYDIAAAIDKADLARKTVKGLHYSNFIFYDGKIHRQALKEKEIENVMERALASREFVIYLQPKYELRTRKIIGAEALARWKKADGSIVGPNEFIPVFERNGFIREFDFYIFRQVCALECRWRAEGRDLLPVAVNFSRIHINDKNFVDKIEQIRREYSIEPRHIEIEMTESAFGESDESSLTIIKDLQALGFSLAMDDFGTGYSSLNLLKEASFDILKLDKSFLVNKEVSVKEKILISNIIRMAKELEIKVVAEGIETAEQERFLADLSCDVGQGYYFSQPIPVEDFENLVWNK